MKTNYFKKYFGGVLALLFCATMEIHASSALVVVAVGLAGWRV